MPAPYSWDLYAEPSSSDSGLSDPISFPSPNCGEIKLVPIKAPASASLPKASLRAPSSNLKQDVYAQNRDSRCHKATPSSRLSKNTPQRHSPRDFEQSSFQENRASSKSGKERKKKTPVSSSPRHQMQPPQALDTPTLAHKDLLVYHNLLVTNLTHAILTYGINTFSKDDSIKRGLVGLENLGGTCYFNSVIHGLLHTPSLRKILLGPSEDPAHSFVPSINPKNRESASSKGCLPSYLSAFFCLAWKRRGDGSRPVKLDTYHLHGVVSNAINAFQDKGEQQDAQECLLLILVTLAEDLNTPRDVPLPPPERMRRLSLAEQERLHWVTTRARYQSSVDDVLLSHEMASNTCSDCFRRSYSFSPIRMLSLEIPKVEGNEGLDLAQCLDSYYQAELVRNWECGRCGGRGAAWHQLFLNRFPGILILHLKRFYGPTLPKVTTLIKFPFRGLRLGKYTSRELSGGAVNPLYDLMVVITHAGTLAHGHYMASVLGEDGFWHLLDDTAVRPIHEPVVYLPPNAYILLYKRRTLA